jgi:cyanate lyase
MILLKRGYQKRLILDSKNKKEYTWKELANKLGVNENYLISELVNEKRSLSKAVFEKLSIFSEKNYRSFILKELEDNWGRSKGGKNSAKKEQVLVKE